MNNAFYLLMRSHQQANQYIRTLEARLLENAASGSGAPSSAIPRDPVRLVRILETHPIAQLRGLLATLDAQANNLVHFTSSHPSLEETTFVSEYAYIEVIRNTDSSRAVSGDRVRITADSAVVTFKRATGDGRWMYQCADDPNICVAPLEPFKLLPSDTPLTSLEALYEIELDCLETG